ncbi:MAG: ATP-binding protein [Pseudomonadales bacterium]
MPSHMTGEGTIVRKILLIFLTMCGSLLAFIYFVMRFTVFPAFEAFEREQAAKNLAAAQSNIEYEMQILDAYTGEYSDWTVTYKYLTSANQQLPAVPGFIDTKVAVDYWEVSDISAMLLFNRHEQYVEGRLIAQIDGEDERREFSVESTLLPHWLKDPAFLHFESDYDYNQGLLASPLGVMLVCSFPVLKSDSTGPYAGAVVVASLLNKKKLSSIGARTNVDIKLHQLSHGVSSLTVDETFEMLQQSTQENQFVLSDEIISSRTLLRDMFDKPVAILEVQTPRKITVIGRQTINAALGFLSLAIMAFFLIMLYFMRRTITNPLLSLRNHIAAIRHSGNLTAAFDNSRRDEIGILASEFNSLTAELNHTQRELVSALEHANIASKAKNEFIANMSHEIRTPMNGVIGITNLLFRTDATPRQQRLLNTLKTSGDMLLNVVNDILDFSKLNAGEVEIEKKLLSLRDMIRDLELMTRPPAEEKDIEYIVNLDDGLPDALLADEHRIKQVLMNLVNNAIKFTDQGSITLAVKELESTPCLSTDRVSIEFKVSDTGVGISNDAQLSIFDAFTQADAGTSREYGGTGLGLAISKQLVNAMGGELFLSSIVGEGSEFRVLLPLDMASAVSSVQLKSEAGALQQSK